MNRGTVVPGSRTKRRRSYATTMMRDQSAGNGSEYMKPRVSLSELERDQSARSARNTVVLTSRSLRTGCASKPTLMKLNWLFPS